MWDCEFCQESVDDDFDVCWNCCAYRPGTTLENEGSSDSEEASNDASGDLHITTPESADRPQSNWRVRLSGAASLMSRLPCVVIALLLHVSFWLLPMLIANYSGIDWPDTASFAIFGVTLFIPRAIQHRDWRGLAGMAVFGAIAPFLTHWAIVALAPRDSLFVNTIANPLILVLLAGWAEWLRSSEDSWGSLSCVTIAGCGAAFALGLVSYLIDVLPLLSDWTRYYLYSALLVTAVWLSIPWGFRISRHPTSTWRVASGFGLVIAAAGYCWFMSSGVYWLAERSLQGAGPLDKKNSVQLLARRGKETDFQLIADKLADADWDAPFAYPANQWDNTYDWRYQAVNVLIEHDESLAAERLSAILLARPSRQLIDMTEGLFVRQRRYETVPIYLRYAEVESMKVSAFATVGRDRFKLALEELRVPQVVNPWLRAAIYTQIFSGLLRARQEGREFTISDDQLVVNTALRNKLKPFFGKDAGKFYLDWNALYEEAIQTAPSPLSDSVRHEADRVVECFEEYHIANGRLAEAQTLAKQNNWTSPIEPAKPNWDIPTIEGLQREIDEFGRQVEMAIEAADPRLK